MANPQIADRNPPLSQARGNGLAADSAGPHRDFHEELRNNQLAHFNMRRYRPLGPADMFDEAFDLYKNNFRLLLVSTSIVYLPVYIILMAFFNPLMLQLQELTSSGSPDVERMLDLFARTAFDTILASVVVAFTNIITSGAVGYIVGQRFLGRDVTIGEADLLAGKRVIVLCLSVIVAGLFGSLFLLGCGVAALIPAARFSILPQVVMLERLGTIASVKRCWSMTGEAFWRLGTVLSMLFVVDLIMHDALTEPLTLIQSYLAAHIFTSMSAWGPSEIMLAGSITGALVGLLIQPLGIAVMTVAYYEIRIREEGFDMAIINELLDHGSSDAIGALPENKSRRQPVAARRR